MTGITAALSEFMQLLVSAVSDYAVGVAGGISAMAEALFLAKDGTTGAVTGLSVFGGIVGIFAGIAISVGITTLVYHWITNLGK